VKIRIKENDPGFFGLAVASASAGYAADARGECVHLGAVVEDPAFVVVEHAAVVVVHVEARGDGDLAEVGIAGRALTFFFGAAKGGEKKSGEDCDNGDDDKEFDEREPRCGTRSVYP